MSTGVRALATQTVVITGSTQGLGFGYAREFLVRGLNVVVSGRDPQTVARAVEQLAAEGAADRVSGCACDVADLAAVEALWTHAINRFGSVDIWLNNAGYARTGARFADTTPAEIESMVRANVIGSMNAAQVAIAGMQRQGHGKLYLTLGGGGASGRVVPGMSVYSTTKRAVKYFADCLVKERQEQRDSNILVGTISPGINLTEGMLRELNQLPAADRRHGVDRLDAGLQRLVHGLAAHDAGGLDLDTTVDAADDVALAVDGLTEGVDHAAEEGLTHRDLNDLAGALDLVALLDAVGGAEERDTHVVLLEVQDHAFDAARELDHFASLDAVEAVDAGDTVADRQNLTDIGDFGFNAKILDLRLQDARNFCC